MVKNHKPILADIKKLGDAMKLEKQIMKLIEVSLAIDTQEAERTGIHPFLSRNVFDYGIKDPGWDWKEISKQVDLLENEVGTLPAERQDYLFSVVDAYRVMARFGLGEKIPYQERVKTFLQLDSILINQSEIETTKEKLCRALAEAGYPDNVNIGLQQWKSDQAISGAEMEKYGQEILSKGRQHVVDLEIGLPSEQHTKLNFPMNYPYRGYSSYDGKYQGQIWLNGEVNWERPSLKHTILHEAYPGHQTFSAIREKLFNEENIDVEATLCFYNTGISPIHEGQCELSMEMIGMEEGINDVIQALATDYTNGIETNLAIACNEGRLSSEDVAKVLIEETCMDPKLAKVRYGFFTNPLWSTCFPHYYHGRKFIRDIYRKMKQHGFAHQYAEMVFTKPHTVKTLEKAVNEFLQKNSK